MHGAGTETIKITKKSALERAFILCRLLLDFRLILLCRTTAFKGIFSTSSLSLEVTVSFTNRCTTWTWAPPSSLFAPPWGSEGEPAGTIWVPARRKARGGR